jgi:hypothetical protein
VGNWEWFSNYEVAVVVHSLGARPAYMFFSSRFLDLVVIGRFNLCRRAILYPYLPRKKPEPMLRMHVDVHPDMVLTPSVPKYLAHF